MLHVTMNPTPILLLTRPTILGTGTLVALKANTQWSVQVASPIEDMEWIQHPPKDERPELTIIDGTAFNAFELFERLGHRSLSRLGKIVMLTTQAPQEEYLFHYLKWGIAAFTHASHTPQALVSIIQNTLAGISQTTEDILGLPIPEADIVGEETPPTLLSKREKEILTRIARGESNKEIALLFNISAQTVKNHITAILRKLHVPDRTAATVVALEQEWIEFPGEQSFPNPSIALEGAA